MYSEARRQERRTDIFDELRKFYTISDIIDYSLGEKRGLFLEGTGGLVLDHIARVAYSSLSRRASPELIKRFCDDFGYEPMIFECADELGQPIYHTNVVMCIGTEFALIGAELIKDKTQRDAVTGNLRKRGTVIELSGSQIADFAGNALELDAGKEKLLVLSERACQALTEQQRNFDRAICAHRSTLFADDRARGRQRPLHDRRNISAASSVMQARFDDLAEYVQKKFVRFLNARGRIARPRSARCRPCFWWSRHRDPKKRHSLGHARALLQSRGRHCANSRSS